MTVEMPDLQGLLERVGRVERENHRWKQIAAVVALGFAAVLLQGQVKASRVVQAEKLIIQDPSGKIRAELGTPPDGRVSLVLFDQNGKSRAELRVLTDGRTGFLLQDRDEKVRAAMRVLTDGTPVLSLFDKDERIQWRAP